MNLYLCENPSQNLLSSWYNSGRFLSSFSFRISLITGLQIAHFNIAVGLSRIPITPPSAFSILLFCSWAWSITVFEKTQFVFRTVKRPFLKAFIVKMQNIYNLIGSNSVHISDIFNCYRANINGMWNARKLGGIYKTFEFTLT